MKTLIALVVGLTFTFAAINTAQAADVASKPAAKKAAGKKLIIKSFTGQIQIKLPDGSIIVKENVGTSPEVTEAVLTVMWKVAGFDPENNDWFWANMMSDGQIVAEGKVQGCTACHGGARSNDFIFVQQF